MVSDKNLRIIAASALLPAIPLCIISSIVTHRRVPAVGLVPLSVSAAWSAVLAYNLHRSSRKPTKGRHHHHHGGPHHDADNDPETASIPSSAGPDESPKHPAIHPLIGFLFDIILAVSFFIVLFFTWITIGDCEHEFMYGNHCRYQFGARASMVATYTTIPLLLAFFIHAYFPLRTIAQRTLRCLDWDRVPPACPHCGESVRPPGNPLAVPIAKKWMSGPGRNKSDPAGYASLLAGDGADDAQRYRDSVEQERVPTPAMNPASVGATTTK
ncbi:hypothetical protein B0H63DRAFT_301425 [Podospora didyma]|uniref:Uncharacterized protein n=1 Tax=Podospora didyma TaxID=330526 RepID=A0AAE0K9G9_9PEZI|nr:hypothetical protein B0H63DRAFT_301425 [Podospora didyma]